MKRIYLIFLALFLAIASIIFFITKPSPLPNDSENKTVQQPIQAKEQLILNSMSVEEKVGQLFIIGFKETELTSKDIKFLNSHYIGGVIIYGRNITSRSQLKKLILTIHATNSIPLFISIDQEGGVVSRLQWNDTLTKAQSAIKNQKESYDIAKARGKILKDTGINMNFAPVVEYITDKDSFLYDRVYRGSKKEVLQKSIGAIQGYTASGIISVPKHFPGDSNTSKDSHTDLPNVEITSKQWNSYIEPFSKVLLKTPVDAIMLGHIKFSKIDPYPASISNEIINTRLVQGLGYKGLVITDDMGMGALKDIKSAPRLAKLALNAGEDILMYSNDQEVQILVYNYILKEVKKGNINIDNKVLKIIQTKIKYDIIENNYDNF